MMQAVKAEICPELPEEIAECCAMGWLKPEDAAAFRRHAATCSRCAEVLADYAAFARQLRAALEEARAEAVRSQ